MTTALVFDKEFLQHDTGANHPESADRLNAIMQLLRKQPYYSGLASLQAQPASLEWIQQIHPGGYAERVARACVSGQRYLDAPDVSISRESYQAGLLAAGAAFSIADAVIAGQCSNGLALIRPPGHHAEAETALGFCLFNNIAITARYLQVHHDLEKILIVDWDVHHGNGTQHLFEEDPTVCYISLHQYPHYPGTGAYAETGIGRGVGATLNCPLTAGSDDEVYREAFKTLILPKANEFKPDAVLISAGFDAHILDPLGDIRLQSESFRWMTQELLEIARKHAENRLISLLEGGYHLGALADSVNIHLQALVQGS